MESLFNNKKGEKMAIRSTTLQECPRASLEITIRASAGKLSTLARLLHKKTDINMDSDGTYTGTTTIFVLEVRLE
jgi:hypothetical protein